MLDERIVYSDSWDRDDGITQVFFDAPKEMLGDTYPEAECATIMIEFPTNSPKVGNVDVEISPTKWDKDEDCYVDYDWCAMSLNDDEIIELMKLANIEEV